MVVVLFTLSFHFPPICYPTLSASHSKVPVLRGYEFGGSHTKGIMHGSYPAKLLPPTLPTSFASPLFPTSLLSYPLSRWGYWTSLQLQHSHSPISVVRYNDTMVISGSYFPSHWFGWTWTHHSTSKLIVGDSMIFFTLLGFREALVSNSWTLTQPISIFLFVEWYFTFQCSIFYIIDDEFTSRDSWVNISLTPL